MNTSARHCRRLGLQNGFTLVEAMVTLAVAAILLAWAVPSMQSFISRNQMSTEVNNFMASLYFARSEAVKRLQNVKLCPANASYTECTGTQWHSGWILFVDLDNDDKVTNGTDVVIQQNPPIPQLEITSGRSEVVFTPTGSTAGTNDTFTFCDSSAITNTRKVILSLAGRVYVEPQTTSDCTSDTSG